MSIDNLITQIQKKNKKYISRAISLVENDNPITIELLKNIHKFLGNSYKIGITGPPGAGKSTITNELTKIFLKQNKSVGIIAVDPTSPFTGGAVLGDRIRMNEIGTDENVFIRSMATRGSLGGLSKKANDAADILDVSGFDFIIFETVGVGQSELDIAKTADSTLVVLVPESGDSVQAMKAGLMEIADFFVMNKSDRPGADSAILSLQTTLLLRDHDENSYLTKILPCTATEGRGILEIYNEILEHQNHLFQTGDFTKRRMKNLKLRIKEIVHNNLEADIWTNEREKILIKELEKLEAQNVSVYDTAEKVLQDYKYEILNKNNKT